MPRSKFGDIYRDLKTRIEDGEYPYQSLVPSENTLVSVYGCSRNTVRRALAGLIEAGYVQPIQGVEGRALILDDSYFLRSVVTALTPEAAADSIYSYLERELGIQIMTSKRTITVERATPEDRLYLDMGSFDCMAVVTNQAFDSDGILFEYTVSHYHPEYFRFQDTASRRTKKTD